ncbi:MAG TPA: hypothetical protein VGQ58_12525 [Candidatus Limnocylindrales bacterium]|jgi:hypothetical protein|nr:hypothetical protein [Candidatus Limnocylindrales bacterium]
MRRPLALSLIVLGLVVTLIGGTGLFAPFTDRATTGVNSITSGERPRAADLKLAWPATTIECTGETYADDVTTPVISATDAQPGFRDLTFFCLKNAGSADLSISVTVVDLANIDVDCTGDESFVDTSCGGDGAGELGSVIFFTVNQHPCDGGVGTGYFAGALSDIPVVSIPLLSAGAIACGSIETFYPLNRTADEVLRAQTDKVTWKYAFDGTT